MKDINCSPNAPSVKRSGKLIQDVNIGSELKFDKSGIMGFMKSLNPLQFASETIAQLAHYKHQVKILETEQNRVNQEANIRHHQISAALKSDLKLLDERRNALQMALGVASKELEQTHIRRERILDCIDNLIGNISNPSLSSEEKQLSHATISILTTALKDLGNDSTVKLDIIAKNTQKALEAMPRSELILTLS